MPRREPIEPTGWYHVSSRGCYGRTLFHDSSQHEVFLRMYVRVATKHAWRTPAWALMRNHHHFVIRLTSGGLSEGFRELHGGFSRWLHEQQGLTGQGHLFRHAFFARQLKTDAAALVACAYVDLNATRARVARTPEETVWCGYRATIGLDHPRPFHTPADVLELLSDDAQAARAGYRRLVHERLVLRALVPSPNDGSYARG
jgi:REP element-mobilizing transposase RayT